MTFNAGSIAIAVALAAAPACRASAGAEENALKDRFEAIAAQAGLLSAGASLDGRQASPDVPSGKALARPPLEPLFLINGDFEGIAPFDTGLVDKRCTNQAPWGAVGWGLNAATFRHTDDSHVLEGARLRVFKEGDNQVAGIFAKESRGIKMGFARFVQGDAWGGGTSCGSGPASDGRPIGWGRPKPLPVFGRRLALKIDVRNDEVRKFSNRLLRGWFGGTSHIMMAYNIWLSSPKLSKRVVMDLAVVHNCNWGIGPCGPAMREDDLVYHYIVKISTDKHNSPHGQWTRWIIDLSGHIAKAADTFGWDKAVRESLSITQVEFLVEVIDGQGGVVFDNVHLVEVPEGVVIRDASMPLPAPDGADPLPVAARSSRP